MAQVSGLILGTTSGLVLFSRTASVFFRLPRVRALHVGVARNGSEGSDDGKDGGGDGGDENTAKKRRKKPAILSEKTVNVPSFGGSLWVRSPVNVRVKSLGPHEYPNLDQAFVKLLGTDSSQKQKCSLEARIEGHKLHVKGGVVNNVAEADIRDIVADIQIPIVHNLNVDVSGKASIEASDFMESEYCHLKSLDGDILASRIKTGSMTLQTSGKGDILCYGLMQGAIKITTEGQGNVIGDKRFTGPSLDISTDKGDIRVASSYSEQSKFSTNLGSLYLRNIHNESYVAVYEQGDVRIQGVDGSTNIFVKKGDIDCHISQIKHESRIHVEDGDIHLRISDNFPLKIAIDANEIIPDIKFKGHGKMSKKDAYSHYFATIQPDQFSPTLVVLAENGRVILESQDWAASLGLKLPSSDIKKLS